MEPIPVKLPLRNKLKFANCVLTSKSSLSLNPMKMVFVQPIHSWFEPPLENVFQSFVVKTPVNTVSIFFCEFGERERENEKK